MKYIFSLAFILVYLFGNIKLGFTYSSPIYTHFTYMFQHAGILHLVINTIAFIEVYAVMEKVMNKYLLTVAILTIGFIASFLSVYELPTVGASSMIYAMLGLYIGTTLVCKSIKITDTRKYLLFLCCIALSLTISYFKPHSNFTLHLYSLLSGITLATIISIYKTQEYKRH